jgi:hypothetical protein
MNAEDALRDELNPKPPSHGPLIAVLLELSMLTVFVMERAWVGVGLCVAYFWFSATCAMVTNRWKAD